MLNDSTGKGERFEKLIIAESQYLMNTLNILFPYEYISEEVDLNWHDMLFAIQNKYLDHHSAINHAQTELAKNDYPQAVLDLACIYPEDAIFSHSICPYIYELADMTEDENKRDSKDKIMYVLLKWVFEHGVNCTDSYYDHPFKVLTTICDDFGFPESILHFAWYSTPSNDVEPDLEAEEKNEDQWLNCWKQFLDEQKLKWKKSF